MKKIELQEKTRWILATVIYSACALTLNVGWTLPFLYGGLTEFPIIKMILPTVLAILAIALFFVGLFLVLPIVGVTETDPSGAES